MLNCIASAETRLGKPPSMLEVFVEMKMKHPEMPINNIY
jgi:hypothetical protein